MLYTCLTCFTWGSYVNNDNTYIPIRISPYRFRHNSVLNNYIQYYAAKKQFNAKHLHKNIENIHHQELIGKYVVSTLNRRYLYLHIYIYIYISIVANRTEHIYQHSTIKNIQITRNYMIGHRTIHKYPYVQHNSLHNDKGQ